MKHILLGLILLSSVLGYGADKKVSDLTALPAASWATGDLFPIVDISTSSTKKTTVGDFDLRYQAIGNYLTGLSGDVTASGPGTGVATISGLARSKLANGTANHVLINDGSGVMSSEAVLAVSRGGTGLASGTSGGILGYTASGTLASSGALTANAIMLGGGAGATPTVLGSLGTTSTVLHGNASGAPSFGAVALTSDVSGVLPIANGGTNSNSLASGAAYSNGTSLTTETNLAITRGGTGAGTKAAAFDALSPMSGLGDMIYGGASGTGTRLAACADGKIVKWASGIPSCQDDDTGSATINVDNYTSNQTLTTGNNVVTVDGSGGAFTITLYTAVGNEGKRLTIKRTDNTLANVITIDGHSSETVGGTATKPMHTINEQYHLISDGSNWIIEAHPTSMPEQDAGAMVVSSSSHYSFTIGSASIAAGTTYSSNGNLFVVSTTSSSSTTLLCYGNGSPGASGTLTYVSGPTAGNRAFSAVSTAGAPAKGSTGSPGYETFFFTRDGSYINYRYDLKTAAGTQGTGDYAFFWHPALRADVTNVQPLTTVISTTLTSAVIHSNIGTGFLSSSIGADVHVILGHSYFWRAFLTGNGSYSASTGGNLASATALSIRGRYRVVDWEP